MNLDELNAHIEEARELEPPPESPIKQMTLYDETDRYYLAMTNRHCKVSKLGCIWVETQNNWCGNCIEEMDAYMV